MVYLGPVNNFSPSTVNRLKSGYSPEHDMPVSKQVSNTQPVPPTPDRRRGDRRRHRRKPMVEMRSEDRRRRRRIDIEV